MMNVWSLSNTIWKRNLWLMLAMVAALMMTPTLGQAKSCWRYLVPQKVSAKKEFSWDQFDQMKRRLESGAEPHQMIEQEALSFEQAMAIGDHLSNTSYFENTVAELEKLRFTKTRWFRRPKLFAKKVLEGKVAGLPVSFRLPVFRSPKDVSSSRLAVFGARIVSPFEFSTDPDQFISNLYTLALHMRSLVVYQRLKEEPALSWFDIKRLKPTNWKSKQMYDKVEVASHDLLDFLKGLGQSSPEAAPQIERLGKEMKISSNFAWIFFFEMSWRLLLTSYDPIKKMPRDMNSISRMISHGPVAWAMMTRIFASNSLSKVTRAVVLAAVAYYGLAAYEVGYGEWQDRQAVKETVEQIEQNMKQGFDDPVLEDDFVAGSNMVEQLLAQ